MTIDQDSFIRKLNYLEIKKSSGYYDLGHLHRITVRRKVDLEAKNWCEEKCGDNWIWSCPTFSEWSDFYFKDADDAFMFGLTFSEAMAQF